MNSGGPGFSASCFRILAQGSVAKRTRAEMGQHTLDDGDPGAQRVPYSGNRGIKAADHSHPLDRHKQQAIRKVNSEEGVLA